MSGVDCNIGKEACIAIALFHEVQLVQALTANGFTPAAPSINKGEKYGLSKKLENDLEWHVRAYVTSDVVLLESEIELSRDYFEHLNTQSRPYYKILGRLLQERGIPFWEVRHTPPDPESLLLPTSRTPWKPLAVVVGLMFLTLVGLTTENQ
jgi:hypothetical protein